MNPIRLARDTWETARSASLGRVGFCGGLGMAVTELAVALGVSTLAALLIYWMVGRPTS